MEREGEQEQQYVVSRWVTFRIQGKGRFLNCVHSIFRNEKIKFYLDFRIGILKSIPKPGALTHSCSFSTWETEEEGLTDQG